MIKTMRIRIMTILTLMFHNCRLERLTTTIQDAGIFSGQLILIEKRSPEGTWPV
jgi:hypothetical protein